MGAAHTRKLLKKFDQNLPQKSLCAKSEQLKFGVDWQYSYLSLVAYSATSLVRGRHSLCVTLQVKTEHGKEVQCDRYRQLPSDEGGGLRSKTEGENPAPRQIKTYHSVCPRCALSPFLKVLEVEVVNFFAPMGQRKRRRRALLQKCPPPSPM